MGGPDALHREARNADVRSPTLSRSSYQGRARRAYPVRAAHHPLRHAAARESCSSLSTSCPTRGKVQSAFHVSRRLRPDQGIPFASPLDPFCFTANPRTTRPGKTSRRSLYDREGDPPHTPRRWSWDPIRASRRGRRARRSRCACPTLARGGVFRSSAHGQAHDKRSGVSQRMPITVLGTSVERRTPSDRAGERRSCRDLASMRAAATRARSSSSQVGSLRTHVARSSRRAAALLPETSGWRDTDNVVTVTRRRVAGDGASAPMRLHGSRRCQACWYWHRVGFETEDDAPQRSPFDLVLEALVAPRTFPAEAVCTGRASRRRRRRSRFFGDGLSPRL